MMSLLSLNQCSDKQGPNNMNQNGNNAYLWTKMPEISGFFLILICAFAVASPAYAEVLTLSAGLKLVTENSRIIKITRHEEKMAEADTLLAKSRTLPEINASAGYTSLAHKPVALFGKQSVPVSEKNYLTYSLTVQQTLYDFQRNASRYEASRKVLNAKTIDAERVRNLVAIDFVLVYLELLETQNLLKVSEREVERLESHLRDAKTQYEAGVITKNDLLQTEVKISDAKQRRLSIQNLRAVTASRLNNALARPLTAELQIEEIRETSPYGLDIDLEQAWAIAEQQRPELRMAAEMISALELEKTAVGTEYFPRFFLRGGYDYTENSYQLHEENWSVTLGMGINLYQGGRTRAEIRKIGEQRLKLLEERDKLKDDIRLEVQKYLFDAKTAQGRANVTKDSVAQAEENLRINRVKYAEGVGTATEVLDAVALLTVAETNFYRSLYDLKKAEAAVLYALGKDLLEVYN